MQQDFLQGTMDAVTAAVAPVVMISANAILISAISAKHQAMSDRMRMLTAEWRSVEAGSARRAAILAQIALFRRRIRWIGRSHFLLYSATVCFLLMVLVIALTPVVQTWSVISVPLLVSGVSIMVAAIVLELLDLRKAQATLELDSGDLFGS
jgi:hypothetical protein